MCDTVELFLKQYKIPALSSSNTATRAELELSEELKHPHRTQPFSPLNQNTLKEIKELSTILSDETKKIATPT